MVSRSKHELGRCTGFLLAGGGDNDSVATSAVCSEVYAVVHNTTIVDELAINSTQGPHEDGLPHLTSTEEAIMLMLSSTSSSVP
jgi:hypothetical protein